MSSVLNNNSGSSGGGGAFFRGEASVVLVNTDFSLNNAAEGRGVFSKGSSNVNITECCFKKNIAAVVAGALAASEDSSLFVQSSTFLNNSAKRISGIFGYFFEENVADLATQIQ